ncbi:hypothetical protein HMN09_01340800 [Mycena chlorophos]|uniref:Uncharacterized protein n=1 Tax=Mycena chlorophos TaxID=658473 RepID=A0A8H6RYV6_MYCCL|nr:hypothetical protein HMN09_01340800 [Mycena chlorophos]
MTSPSSSTPSLLSVTTTVSSRTLLAQYDTIPAAKDFSDALASLQSTYGFGGAVPTPIPNDVPHLIPTPSRAPTKVRDVAFDTQSSKDYERAFGDLQSSYGFCGPIGPHRTPKRTRAARKSASGLPLAQPTSKNYRVVLAKLQSVFGFSGNAPSPVPEKTSALRQCKTAPTGRSILSKVVLHSPKSSS